MGEINDIRIDGVDYPCDLWVTERSGRVIRYDWETGFLGGMGHLLYNDAPPDGYYVSNGFDATTYPYLRLRPRTEATVTLTNFGANTAHGAFGFVEQDAGGTNYLYVFEGRYGWKIDLTTNAVDESFDNGVNAVAGRPAFFNGKWYLPLGVLVDAETLDTVGTPPTGDTWTAITGIKASHFAVIQDGATNKLARTLSDGTHNSKVDLSTDGSTFGDDFEVGEGQLVPADLLTSQGELVVVRDDDLWGFTPEGNSRPLIGFVGRQIANKTSRANFDGVNSHAEGPWAWWTHSTGLWRRWGDQARPIGPESDPRWTNLTLDSYTGFSTGNWHSFVTWGDWAYATFADSLYYGKLRGDGSVHWHGVLFRVAGAVLRCILDESGPNLWITETSNTRIHRFELDQHGAPQGTIGSKRGAASTTSQFWLPIISGGQGELRELIQWRYMWFILENWTANAPLQANFHKDRSSTATTLGSTLTASGTHQVSWTVGTDDTMYEMQPMIEIATNGSYAPATDDPRIRACGVQGLSPQLLRVDVPLTDTEMRGRPLGVPGGLKALRDLRQGAPVAIQEPGMNDSFNGYIEDIQERALDRQTGGGFKLTLFIQRLQNTTDS